MHHVQASCLNVGPPARRMFHEEPKKMIPQRRFPDASDFNKGHQYHKEHYVYLFFFNYAAGE